MQPDVVEVNGKTHKALQWWIEKAFSTVQFEAAALPEKGSPRMQPGKIS